MKLFNISNLNSFYRALSECESPVSVLLADGSAVPVFTSESLVSKLVSPLADGNRIPSIELRVSDPTDGVRIINASNGILSRTMSR